MTTTIVDPTAAERVARGWPAIAPLAAWRRWYRCGWCGTWTDINHLTRDGGPHPSDCTPEAIAYHEAIAIEQAHWDQVRAEQAARIAAMATTSEPAPLQLDLFGIVS